MPLVVGIDEAGYGPLLGPLVIGATLWQVPPENVHADWWERLSEAVCLPRRTARCGDGRLPVADSKQVYDRKRGICSLERTVLAFARAADLRWQTLSDLLDALGCNLSAAGSALPWYHELHRRLPMDPLRSSFEGAADRLMAAMRSAKITCCGLQAELLTEDVFNRRVDQTRNKAAVLLEGVLRLLQWAGARAGNQDVYARIDRLGGRASYRTWLLPAFPERHLHVVAETADCSIYRLASRTTDWHIEFRVDGDQRYLPTALASMLAKYVRELLMERFNAYWQGLAPKLRPTAGYYSDAQRFLADIQPLLAGSVTSGQGFVRTR